MAWDAKASGELAKPSTASRISASRLRVWGILESSLYLSVKRFLEQLGFEVKGEVCGCDLVALSEGGPTAVVIGELKLTFTLDLVLQAVDRTAVCDEVWLAVRASRRGRGRECDPRVKKLCRFLGLGLLSVFASGKVEVLWPIAWAILIAAQKCHAASKDLVDRRRRVSALVVASCQPAFCRPSRSCASSAGLA